MESYPLDFGLITNTETHALQTRSMDKKNAATKNDDDIKLQNRNQNHCTKYIKNVIQKSFTKYVISASPLSFRRMSDSSQIILCHFVFQLHSFKTHPKIYSLHTPPASPPVIFSKWTKIHRLHISPASPSLNLLIYHHHLPII